MTLDDKFEEIEGARIELERAKEKLLDAYLTKIKEGYHLLNEQRQRSLIKRLGLFLDNLSFDSDKAKQIRLNAGFSLKQLGKEIGVSATYIAHLENEVRIPRRSSKGIGIRKYLDWLKEKGYNPYNI